MSSLQARLIRLYLRFAFVLVIVIPACALVIWRNDVALTDPKTPHLATQNMSLAVLYAYALACARASLLPTHNVAATQILVGFGGFYLLATGALITFGLYYLLLGIGLLILRWPNPVDAVTGWIQGVVEGVKDFPKRLRDPKSPKVASYWALFCACLLASVVGLLQPGIGLAFRWYPYPDPTRLTPTESLICGFFIPAVLYLFAYWHRLYDEDVILFTEFISLMGFFHGFAMMIDSIAGTQGNDNVHHILGGDVVLMWLIGSAPHAHTLL
ncbi:hypothetical protein BCR44DRAFT_1430801 [Catenaria anguillulae PL171]|uniref:Uncharacterized protein n=1 Tax=Catenaria anguillulae PL171 TaxID=765915 RepID=A0A1Y2HTI5_9FUNG|nr:hypothetical protein BCR44DRAFT_1430801 [Catenaria anguillulae PL171]